MKTVWSVVALATYVTAITINENYTMCSWARLRAGVIRDTLYLDGGELWWQKAFADGTTSDPTSDGNVEGDMYLLNFSQPFNTGSTNLSSLFTPKQKAGGAANNIAPNFIDGTMFVNNGELYLYGYVILFPQQHVVNANIYQWTPLKHKCFNTTGLHRSPRV